MGDKETIEALRASEELNRRIIESVPGGVVHVSIDGSIQRGNAEGMRILGMSFDELTQRYTQDFETETIWEDGSSCPVEAYPVTQALMTGKAAGPTTIGVRRPDGHVSWAVFRAVPVRDGQGAVSGAVVTFLDITERRALEEKMRHSQKLESLGMLAGGIAHDFNNLLTVMLASASLARLEVRPGSAVAEYIEQLEAAAHRASGLTRQMLAYSGKAQLRIDEIDLRGLVREILSLLQTGLPKTASIDLRCAPLLPLLLGDPDQLHQMVVNLVTNASEALGGKAGVIHIRIDVVELLEAPEGSVLVEELTPGSYVRLEVTDGGAGMDDATRDRIFDPFFTTRDSGRGLGLATTLGIVRGHQGAIVVNSAPGEGTTFEVFLPATDAIVEEPRSRSVLVVDDERIVQQVIAQVLERGGYRVVTASGGPEALERLRAGGIDAVVLDCSMPGMSGNEVLARMKVEFAGMPVLMMSGYSETVVESVPFLAKPFRAPDLLEAVSALPME